MVVAHAKPCVKVRIVFTAERPGFLRRDVGKTIAEAGITKMRSTVSILVHVNAIANNITLKMRDLGLMLNPMGSQDNRYKPENLDSILIRDQ